MRHLVCIALMLLPLSARAQEPAFPVPDKITVDGVPPIPMSVAKAVSPYGQFRAARLLGWHPSDPRLLILTALTGVNQIHEVRGPGGTRTPLTSFPDGVGVASGAAFDPSGRYFVFRKDTSGGGEVMQLFRYDDASKSPVQLTDGKSRHGLPVWSHKTNLIAYDSTRRTGKHRDLYVMNPLEPSSERIIAEVEGTWNALDWSADDKEVLALQLIAGSTETRLWRIAVEGGARTLVTPKEGKPAQWTSAQFSADGKSIYALTDRESNHLRLWRCDLSNGDCTWTLVTPSEAVVELFAVSPSTSDVGVVLDRGARSELQIVDGRSGKPRQIPALPPSVIWKLVWNPTGTRLGVELAGAQTSRDVYAIDLAGKALERWTASEIGVANPGSLPDAEIIEWKSFDGLMIPGILYRPATRFTGPRPVIINVHGGPEARERPRMLGRSNYFRNEMGIAVIYPNIRGSSGFGNTYEHLDDGRKREDAVKDIGALLDWIASRPEFDKSRVLLTGSSYGGYITLASAIAYGDRIRCAIEGFGLTDFVAFLDGTDPSRRGDRLAEYGDPADPEMRAFLKSISPLTHAAKLKIPLFIAQGAKDSRVPLDQAAAMVKAVRAGGSPVWYIVYDSGHEELTAATNDYTIFAWTVFIQQYLLN